MIKIVTQHPVVKNRFCTDTEEEESARDVAKRVAEYAAQQLGCGLSYEDVRFVDVGEAGESIYDVPSFDADGQAVSS
jgi:hypothetical protein